MVLGIGVVAGTGVVICGHGLKSFFTLQVPVQYAEKHQPSPTVSVYIRLSEERKKSRDNEKTYKTHIKTQYV